jgi:hypothetical protein
MFKKITVRYKSAAFIRRGLGRNTQGHGAVPQQQGIPGLDQIIIGAGIPG